jgi:hypothetical protein
VLPIEAANSAMWLNRLTVPIASLEHSKVILWVRAAALGIKNCWAEQNAMRLPAGWIISPPTVSFVSMQARRARANGRVLKSLRGDHEIRDQLLPSFQHNYANLCRDSYRDLRAGRR